MYKRVLLEEARSRGLVCDFCAAFHPEWVYAARRMSTGQLKETWRWAACHECAAAIEREDWVALRARIKAAFIDMMAMPTHMIDYAITNALREFFEWAVKERVQ
jgi:hypothetical protein